MAWPGMYSPLEISKQRITRVNKFENNCWKRYRKKHIRSIAKEEEIEGAVEFQVFSLVPKY
jgi:hypothetical protein